MSVTAASFSAHRGLALAFLVFAAALSLSAPVEATRIAIAGPPGSKAFGSQIVALPSGRFVVVDPLFGPNEVGAVHLLTASGDFVSTLTGSHSQDLKNAYVVVLKTGDFVVSSAGWDNASVVDAGALTWISASNGLNGAISAQNSLVGTREQDLLTEAPSKIVPLKNGGFLALLSSFTYDAAGEVIPGAGAIIQGGPGIVGSISPQRALVGTSTNDMYFGQFHELANGTYVASLPHWKNRDTSAEQAGAVVWLGASQPTTGIISATNALIGTTLGDHVGAGVLALRNGNYLVANPDWQHSTVVGAITWRDGSRSHPGVVSQENSVLGSETFDFQKVGLVETSTGDALILAPNWDDPMAGHIDAGAVGGMSGRQATAGVITTANSLTGALAGNQVGYSATVLENKSVVVSSQFVSLEKGAVTLFQGTFNLAGQRVSPSNSLLSGANGDGFGSSVTPLKGGKFVVGCRSCDISGHTDAGLVRFVGTAADAVGEASAANSLTGRLANDQVGSMVTALTNGNYVVTSFHFNADGIPQAGAATWVDGNTGHPRGESSRAAVVTSANSLTGATASDRIGFTAALSNGNYLVLSPAFDAAGQADVGAITLARGDVGMAGTLSAVNSLVGGRAADRLGADLNNNQGAVALSAGRFLVGSPNFDLQSGQVAFLDAGAVTFGDGWTGMAGALNTSNSYIPLGNTGLYTGQTIARLKNGDGIIVTSRLDTFVNNVRVDDAGAVTFVARGAKPGVIDPVNSVFGTMPGEGVTLRYDFNAATGELIVGRPMANEVVLFEPARVFRDDFEAAE